MKICMMTNTYLPHVGGVARSVETFTHGYCERSHPTLVVAPTFAGAQTDQPGVIRMPAIQNFNGSDFSVRLPVPAQLKEKLDDFKPEIIHSHHPFLMGDTALRVSRARELPLVFTHHTLYERYTHYVPFDSESMQRLAVQLATAYANMCSLAIAPSESIAELMQQRGVRTRIEVVPTGIDIDAFRSGNRVRGRERWGLPDSAFVIGHVGRLAYEKNLIYLAEAVAKSLENREDAWFLIVGEGAAQNRMREFFRAQDVSGRVIFTGKISGDELYDAYSAMDLFVFASMTETQGMVLAEAMAANLPVVALDAPGAREVVTDDHNGRLLEADAEPQRFSTVLSELLDDPETCSRMAGNAAETAQLLTHDRSIDRMLELYSQLRDPEQRSNAAGSADSWDRFLSRLEAEWDLVSEKMKALSASFFTSRDS